MARKLVYFVRHGESILNAKHIRQGREGGLSELGRVQAGMTGQRLESFRFDVMLASPFDRTRETAEVIAKHLKLDKPIEYLDILGERRNPKEIIGKSADDPEVTRIVDIIDRSFHEDGFRYSDEENFNDLKDRAKQLLTYLATRKESTLLIVTHSIFLKMVAAYIAHGDKLTAKKYNHFSYKNDSNNASITVAEYDCGRFKNRLLARFFNPAPEDRWKILAWDDYTR